MGERARADRTGFFLAAVLIGVAALGFALPNSPQLSLALVGPFSFLVAVLAGLSTAAVLFATWTTSPDPRSTFVLALSFASSGAIILLAMLVLPLVPQVPPMLAAPAQAGIWLFVFWHVGIAAGALISVAVRRNEAPVAASHRFVTVAVLAAVVSVTGCVVAALVFGDRLPVLVVDARLGPAFARFVGPFLALLAAAAAVAVRRIERPTSLDRALALALFALAMEALLLTIGGQRYTVSFYASKVLLLFGASFVLFSAAKTLLASRVRLAQVEVELSRSEVELARRAGRIRAVWQIASQYAPDQTDLYSSILAIATEALRPGLPMMGLLSHLEGENIVIDGAAWTGEEPMPAAVHLVPGSAFPFATSLQTLLTREGVTMAWDDLSAFRGRGMLFEQRGWQSFIGASVTIARRTYYVTFASRELMLALPFEEDDVAFVDVIASFFASRFTEEQQFERIKFQIEHDALTGLANRVHFRKAVRDEIAKRRPFAIAFVDLDGFRHINESEGHQIGDEVLVEVGSGLRLVDEGNLVSRMSADEFGVLIRGAGSADVGATLEQYARLFRSPFHTGDRNGTQLLGIGASIGAARFPEHGNSAEDLMRRADVALTVAKSRGGSTALQFDRPMEAILEETHLRVVELSDAIARNELALVYQPTFDLATRRTVGAEALVRWDHPVRGRVLPSEFVDFAERNGLIGALSEWVLRQVVSDLRRQELPPGVRVYFNLSPRMLDDIPFITVLHDALRANPALVEHLGVEVTETAAMQNAERSMRTIDLFRGWGLSVAIDDFGTGYSSLAYLKQLTVDVIKLDRSFVTGLPDDERDCALADMLLQITGRFGFTTLAEGIETEAQARWLLDHGCRLGQGYLISKPRSFDDLLARLGVLNAV